MVAVRAFVFRSEVDPLDRPEDVGRREDHGERGDRRQRAAVVPARERHQDLADEAAQAGQPETGEEHGDRQAAVDRHPVEDAAELLEVAVVDPVIEHADHEEHAGRRDAVGQHLEHRAVDPLGPGVPAELVAGDGAPHAQSEHHVAHVAHRTVGHHPLEVLLGERREGAVDHGDHAEPAHQPGERQAGPRADRVADPEDAVATELEQHAGQDHRDRRRCLDMGVGQPGVHRHHRHLDDEADQEQQEGPDLQAHAPHPGGGERGVGQLAELGEGQEVEGVDGALRRPDGGHRVGLGRGVGSRADDVRGHELGVGEHPHVAREVEHQHRDEHQDRAEERVEEELDRRVFPPRAAPDTDQEVHRQEHHLPEHVEQEEVERHEHAEHARLEQQKEHVIRLHVLRDRPAGGTGEHREEGGEHHQRHADAVHAQQIVDVEGRDPGPLDHVLHRRLADGELAGAGRAEERRPRHPEGEHEDHDGGAQGDPADRLLAGLGDDRQREHGSHERGQEHDQRQGPEGGLRQGVGGRHRRIRLGFRGMRIRVRRPRQPARACRKNRLAITNRATVPRTMNVTYWRRLPVCSRLSS